MNLQKLLLVYILAPLRKMRENRLCRVHAIDLAKEEVFIVPGTVPSRLDSTPLLGDPLPVNLPCFESPGPFHWIFGVLDDAG